MSACRTAGVVATVLVLVASCNADPFCTQSIEPAVRIAPIDDSTGEHVASAYGAVHDGPYIDSLRAATLSADGDVTTLRAADERPGVYHIAIRAQGYMDWDTTGIQVAVGRCHVVTSELTAKLTRL